MGNDSLNTPIAIVIAGALVGAGLYFGLRSGRSDAPSTAPVASATVPALTTRPPSVAATPPETAAPVAKEVVVAAVAKALEAARADLVAKCWEPHARAHPGAKPFKSKINVSVGPDGKQAARGVVEDRTNDRSNVGVCVTQTLPAIEVPPPGVATFVEVPFVLP